MKYVKGERVALLGSALSLDYLAKRNFYIIMYAGMSGTVLGYNAKGDKLAIQFDDMIFPNHLVKLSSFDNGCHGRGKMHHCTYIPEEMVTNQFMEVVLSIVNEERKSELKETIDYQKNLLLLLK
jgi:hypothetical protein